VVLWLAILTFGAAWIGCSPSHESPPTASATASSTPAGRAEADFTACNIALAPLGDTDPIDQQIHRLQQQARVSTNSIAALDQLGWLLVARARDSFDPGYYKLAEQCALCMDARQPHAPEALLLRGHALHSVHRFKEAETLARELVTLRGSSPDYALLGDALMEQGNLDEATRAYQSMMDKKPGLEAYTRTAHMRWLRGDLSGAIAVMQMAVDASSPRQPEIAAWVHVGLALYQLQAHNIQDASHLLETALVLRPNYAPALAARGRLLLAEGNAEDAAESLRQAANLHPLIETQWLLVEALRATDQSEQAQGVERQVIERGPLEDPRTLALYLATTRQNVAAAVRLAEKELDTRQDVFTWDAIAWTHRAAGQLEQAYTDSQRAVAQGTQDARLFLHAGAIAAESGRPAESKRWLEQAAATQQMLFPSERRELERQLDGLRSHVALRTPEHPGLATDASEGRSR